MSPISAEFAVFVAGGLCTYYIVPKNVRWIVLLALSLIFYTYGGAYLLLFLAFTVITSYFAGVLLGMENDKLLKIGKGKNPSPKKLLDRKSLEATIKARKKGIVFSALILNFGLLFILKYAPTIVNAMKIGSDFEILLPLGISFYIFQTSGYIIDVYRGKFPPQRNLAKFALFASFFPQIIQGPIGRYGDLSSSLFNGNDFSFDSMKSGLKLLALGLFKKLVIADRAAVVACAVIDSYGDFDGGVILAGVVFYCIQLYCDFSGGIDIMRGVARLFGITLAENFRRPIFAVTLTDFWRRWHITLGAWMKDYLFYPMTLSKPFAALGRFTRKHLKGRAAKILPVSCATFIIYFAIGVWHGASGKYIVFGLWNGVLITAALLCEPLFVRLKAAFHINFKSKPYSVFCMVRTAIIVLFGRFITRAATTSDALAMLGKTFTDFSFVGLFGKDYAACGLEVFDYIVIALSLAVLLFFEYSEESGETVSEKIDRQKPIWQVLFIFASVLAIVLLGFYKGSYISSEFIYKQF